MWQVLAAAAAAAGSSILAKKFISPNGADIETPISECKQKYLDSDDSVPKSDDAFEDSITGRRMEIPSDDAGVFRFSCPGTASKELRKNARSGFGFLKKNGGSKMGKKKKGAANVAANHQVGDGSGKRVSICLKKRRTGKHAAGKCESCVSKDNSFGWGVGVGIMYMMQAGTAEISKLNSAMDETVKTVQELKAEISRRRNAQNVNVSVAANEAKTNETLVERDYNNPVFTRIGVKNKEKNVTSFSGEYASSILSDNQQPEVLEMHQLEAELESELQKLPWCAMEASSSEGRTDVFEGVLAEGHPLEEFENSDSYQYNGVLPGELNQKLCHLLVEQQENQIMELETELHQAHSKLHQKEAELQALKDCVKRLTEFSLVNASGTTALLSLLYSSFEWDMTCDFLSPDEEGEEEGDDAKALIGDGIEEKVGTKRSIGYESYICSEK